MSDRTHFVYTAWDSAGRPLYVGCSKQPVARQRQHRKSSLWYQYATRFTMTGPYPEETALRVERERIITIRPHFNWQPEFNRIIRARNAREYELTQHVAETDIYTFDWDAVEATLDAEFDIRVTRDGCHRAYIQHISELVAA